ncbi:MAG: hypothetical protein ACK6BG_06610 [Cyanobacteriota bacterium]
MISRTDRSGAKGIRIPLKPISEEQIIEELSQQKLSEVSGGAALRTAPKIYCCG